MILKLILSPLYFLLCQGVLSVSVKLSGLIRAEMKRSIGTRRLPA